MANCTKSLSLLPRKVCGTKMKIQENTHIIMVIINRTLWLFIVHIVMNVITGYSVLIAAPFTGYEVDIMLNSQFLIITPINQFILFIYKIHYVSILNKAI